MFRKARPNLIESDAGFSVEQVNISKLVYREGDSIRDAYRSQGFEVDVQLVPPQERESLKRALEQLKRPPATSFMARCLASVKRAWERLKRTLSQH